MNTGKVYLVGAGPGDAGLLTLRGAECLRRADVVLYDYLVNPRVLDHAPDSAEQICLGQHGHSRIWSQEEINGRMVDDARNGKCVVRLKGGDPAIFARVTDELSALVQASVEFEIVPGITAASAAASYAGIPLTHRDSASAVAFVTGQEDGEKSVSNLDYSALAAFPGTLVFYMGVTTARHWSQCLLEAGKPPRTPVAIIRRCSLPDQRVTWCELSKIAQTIEGPPRIRPPAIVVVGDVAIPKELFNWFERRPLFGQRILVTRPRHQAIKLVSLIEELGGEAILQPAIEITPPSDWAAADVVIRGLDEFDWLVFSSANGVSSFLERLLTLGSDLRSVGKSRIAAIGTGTADELWKYHLRADLVPDEFRAESLAASLAEHATGKRFLLVRASRGREVLAEQLRAAGGLVTEAVFYQSTDVQVANPGVLEMLEVGKCHWVTVTSSAIARSVVRMFGDRLRSTKIASISPITSQTLRDLGYEPAVEAAPYTIDALLHAILSMPGAVSR